MATIFTFSVAKSDTESGSDGEEEAAKPAASGRRPAKGKAATSSEAAGRRGRPKKDGPAPAVANEPKVAREPERKSARHKNPLGRRIG
ncbi:unnamed protein product [Caenorhabditis brenneri]